MARKTTHAAAARRIVAECRRRKVELVRFMFVDSGGLVRAKACHTRFLASYLTSGIGLTLAAQSMNSLDQLLPEGSFGPIGEVRIVPDLDSFAVLPYVPRTARLLCRLETLDGAAWGACPRAVLERAIARAAAQGVVFRAAFENEFTLARREGERFVPFDDSKVFSTIGMDLAAPVMMEIIDALQAQGVEPEQYYVEAGPGQQELPVRYAEAMRAADTHVTVRETARGVALEHGLYASFAPKPFLEEVGNGSHVHASLWRTADGRNHFHDARDRYGLSEAAYGFIGGVLAHLPALVALTAPTVNSYRRLQPRFWASAYTAWGVDNREAAVRVASKRRGLEMESSNIELRPCDPTNNPYLALGGLLAAGLDGIARKLDPGEPVAVDPDTLSEAERARRGIRRLPTTLGAALDALERDEVLCDALGEMLAREYVLVKRSEVRAFADKDVAYELAQHFFKY